MKVFGQIVQTLVYSVNHLIINLYERRSDYAGL